MMSAAVMMKLCDYDVGLEHPFFLIAGPCVIESEKIVLETAESLAHTTEVLNIPFIFKASYDKANRTSKNSFRGLGLEKGLNILQRVKDLFNVPILTDVHDTDEHKLNEITSVVDVIQTPAFLCRQTDFIKTITSLGLPVNIKKGQFMAPADMINVIAKTGDADVMICDRGTSFGYNTLISDMRGLVIMRETGCPVVFDATHSVQQPGGKGASSGGQREFVPTLAKSAIAAGVSGLFMETHPDPDNALSDGPNMLPVSEMRTLLRQLKKIDNIIKNNDK